MFSLYGHTVTQDLLEVVAGTMIRKWKIQIIFSTFAYVKIKIQLKNSYKLNLSLHNREN